MSHLSTSNGAKNVIISAAASFIGMLAAIPVSLAIVSATQANAMPVQKTQDQNQASVADASYKQYLQGYTQGYLASVKQDNSSKIAVSNCGQSTAETATSGDTNGGGSGAAAYQPMSPSAWSESVNNSYNTYTSSTNTTNNVTTTVNKQHVTTNINSNNEINSNNTASTDITVKDSAGAVVTNGTTANGTTVTGANVTNKDSNNTTDTNVSVDIDHSFNTDSHNVTVNDSFNKVDATVNNTNNHPPVNKNRHHDCARI